MDAHEIKKLKSYITDELASDAEAIHGASSLFSTRIVNSRNLIQLVQFVEDHFDIRVDSLDLTLENFDTLDRMVDYVTRKRG